MRSLCVLGVLAGLVWLSIICVGGADPVRTWQDTGGRDINAALIGAAEDGASVVLRRTDGQIFTVPRSRLSRKDQDFVAEWLARQRRNTGTMTVWEADPWALPAADGIPEAGSSEVKALRIVAFQGEHLVRALGITNRGDRMIQVLAQPDRVFRDASGISTVPADRHLSLHQVLEHRVSNRSRRDALPRLRFHDPIAVPPGGNGILWLNINTRDLEPGVWGTEIELLPLRLQQYGRRIPIILEVLPVRLPQGPRPYALAYCANPYDGGFLGSRAAGEYSRETAVQDLKDYLVNAFFIPAGETGFQTMEYDEAGRIIGPPDMSAMEKWIDDFGSDNVFFILSLWYDYLPKELGGGGEWGPVQEENFGRFVAYVREFFADRGVGVDSFAWYAHDEPGVEGARSVANFGRLLQATDPEQLIYVTVYGSTPWEALEIMAPYVNLWVPSLGMNDEQRDFLARQNVRNFSYRVWGRVARPGQYRSMGVQAFKLGYEAVGIWAYGAWDTCSGRSLWHDESDLNKYSLTYEGEGELVSSLRKEGWRQGIQDYRYCEWLRELAEETPVQRLAEPARGLLNRILEDDDLSRAVDRAMPEMRPLIMNLLLSLGRIDRQTWRDFRSRRVPALLTHNGEAFAIRRINTGGYYYYDSERTDGTYGESCKVAGGPVYFRGRDAVSGPQAENRHDGNLTDGLMHRPGSFLLFWAPQQLTVTFDFQDVYQLGHVLYYGSQCAVTAYVSASGDDEEWQKVDGLTAQWAQDQVSDDGAAVLDLQEMEGRYLRLRFIPEPERPEEPGKKFIRISEVKVFGFPRP